MSLDPSDTFPFRTSDGAWNGEATAVEIAAAGGGGGGQTLILADDEDKTVPASPGVTIVLYTALTASRVVTLPAAASAPMTVIVKDGGASIGGGAQITFAADGADAFGGSGIVAVPDPIQGEGGVLAYVNDGETTWYQVSDVSNTLMRVFLQITAAAAVTPPAGGATVDAEARAAIVAIQAALQGGI